MSRFFQIFLRLLLVGGIGGAGYLFFAKPQNLPTPLQQAVNTGNNQVNRVLSAVDQNTLLSKAEEKFTEPQSIIEESKANTDVPEVKGASTSQVTDEAKKFLDNAVSQASNELQNLPKKEAAKILRQTCDQIVSDLEK